jgi:pSer/pThr/pTyr-binding forkhead associated (FHA) protein
MMAVYTLKYSLKSHPLPEGETITVGRSRSSDIVCEDPDASRHHGEFKVESGQLNYRDLESTNGSRLNGAPVNPFSWNIFGAGDTLQIGQWQGTVYADEKTVGFERDVIPTPAVDPSAPKYTHEATKSTSLGSELR